MNPAVDRNGRRPDNCEYPWEDAAQILHFPLDWSFNPVHLLRDRFGPSCVKMLQLAVDRAVEELQLTHSSELRTSGIPFRLGFLSEHLGGVTPLRLAEVHKWRTSCDRLSAPTGKISPKRRTLNRARVLTDTYSPANSSAK